MVLVDTPKSRLASVIVILLEVGLEESVTSFFPKMTIRHVT